MNQDEATKKEKQLNKIAWALSIVVLLIVGGMRRFKIETSIDFSFLAPFHATVNALTFFVLLFALYQIKNRNIELHKKSIYVAMVLSFIFLLSYVLCLLHIVDYSHHSRRCNPSIHSFYIQSRLYGAIFQTQENGKVCYACLDICLCYRPNLLPDAGWLLIDFNK